MVIDPSGSSRNHPPSPRRAATRRASWLGGAGAFSASFLAHALALAAAQWLEALPGSAAVVRVAIEGARAQGSATFSVSLRPQAALAPTPAPVQVPFLSSPPPLPSRIPELHGDEIPVAGAAPAPEPPPPPLARTPPEAEPPTSITEPTAASALPAAALAPIHVVAAALEISIQPAYPRRCQRLRHQGTALLRIALDGQWRVLAVELLKSSGCAELDAAALRAARVARFRPRAGRAEQGAGLERGLIAELPLRFRLD